MKLRKKLVAFASALVLAGAPLSQVSAQTYDAEFFQSLKEANNEVTSVKLNGFISASTTSEGQTMDFGKFDFNAQLNQEPIEVGFTGTLSSLFLGGQAINLNFFLKDAVAYMGYPNSDMTGTEWSATDFTQVQDDIKKTIDESIKNATQDLTKYHAINEKYTTVEETDTEYIVSLKENINADELWADLETVIDFDNLKEELKKQAAETGQEITDEDLAQIDQLYTKENLEIFLSFNPKVATHYDKATKLATKVTIAFDIDLALLTEGTDSSLEGFPQVINVLSEINFSEQNQQQTIEVPADALNAPVEALTTTAE